MIGFNEKRFLELQNEAAAWEIVASKVVLTPEQSQRANLVLNLVLLFSVQEEKKAIKSVVAESEVLDSEPVVNEDLGDVEVITPQPKPVIEKPRFPRIIRE